MRILLVNPPYPEKSVGFKGLITVEPLALEYLGAAVSDHEVEILDMVIEPDLIKKMESFKPDLISITGFTVHVGVIRQLCKSIKEINPKITTIVGGSHAFFKPGDFYSSHIDVIVATDDIMVFPKIVSCVQKGSGLGDIAGLHIKIDDKWIHTGNALCISDLDSLPFPNRQLTKKYRESYKWYFHKKVATVWGSVGCPHRCYFCTQWIKSNGKFIARSPESLVSEIETIEEELVFIADDNTFADIKRAEKIYSLIKEKGLKKKFIGYCSPKIAVIHKDLIKKWAEIGLVQVVVGFESIREKDLHDVKNKSSLEIAEKAIEVFREYGIDTMASFIVYPDFDVKDFAALRKYVNSKKLFYSEYTPLTPFPGSTLYEQRVSEITSSDPELFDMQHMVLPAKLPLKEFYRQMSKTYLSSHSLWNALRAKLNLSISFNPFSKVMISYYKFLLNLRRAYKNHDVQKQDTYKFNL
ncbi:MAG: cobalamin-dependent protein [Clostridia bacterium]|nr:cobalamin-dependent protein [Clostridia bacterium]